MLLLVSCGDSPADSLGLSPKGRGRFRAVEDHYCGFEGLFSVAGGGRLGGFPEAGTWHLAIEGSVTPVAGLPRRRADITWAVP